MVLFSRLIVECTEALLGQSRKGMLLVFVKKLMREHEETELITCHFNLKGYQARIQKSRKIAFKEAENWI